MDRYQNFADLAAHETEGRDYVILYRDLKAEVAVMAPHGGGIEPGTIDIADALAGRHYSFYAFKGLKKTGNQVLHLTSDRFDEPVGVDIAHKASLVITVHGCRDSEETVYVGGNHRELQARLTAALTAAGFSAVISSEDGLRGINPENICNRCQNGQGVQLEISRGQRQRMFVNLERRKLRQKTPLFYTFVDTVKGVLP